jgi:hypothetical protein
MVPEMQTGLNADFIELGQTQQGCADESRGPIMTPFKNNLEDILLDVFSPLPHVQAILP